MCRHFSKIEFSYFDDEPFTKREAWVWLATNSTYGKISCSVRYMASLWKWHKSKVERFLQRIKSELLIEKEIKSGKFIITISNYEHFITSVKKTETYSETVVNQNRDNSRYAKTQTDLKLSENTETVSRQSRDTNKDTNADAIQFRGSNRYTDIQKSPELLANPETISRQSRDSRFEQEEEKKKRSKKRKVEELIK